MFCAKFVYFIHIFPTNTHRIGQCSVRICIHGIRPCSVVCARICLHGTGQCSVVCVRSCTFMRCGVLISTYGIGLCSVCVLVCVYMVLRVLQCGSVLQCVAVCCSVLQCVAVCCSVYMVLVSVLWCAYVRSIVHDTLQHAATHCNTLQHAATHCNTLQHAATHVCLCVLLYVRFIESIFI